MDKELEFKKGFNQGYILNKYDKVNFEKLVKGFLDSNEYTEGYLKGGEEATMEVNLEKLNDLNELRSRNDGFELER